jgi:hypothetical protein
MPEFIKHRVYPVSRKSAYSTTLAIQPITYASANNGISRGGQSSERSF